jgi:hypothetical protein
MTLVEIQAQNQLGEGSIAVGEESEYQWQRETGATDEQIVPRGGASESECRRLYTLDMTRCGAGFLILERLPKLLNVIPR